MIILGIETSCDETAAALVEVEPTKPTGHLLGSAVASSIEVQKKFGGIVPELAARKQLETILPILYQTLLEAKNTLMPGTGSMDNLSRHSELVSLIDAIAVTVGPGLVGSLLVGVETAKALAFAWEKPLIPVNHLLAHFYACWLNSCRQKALAGHQKGGSLGTPRFPALGLLVSGGHTDLILINDHQRYQWLGGTRDDAAGEAFDKIARLLGLDYPGGPEIAKKAKQGNPGTFKLPRPMIDQNNLEFSFSGLKTSVLYLVRNLSGNPKFNSNQKPNLTPQQTADLAASAQEAIVDVLVAKVKKALTQTKAKSLIVAGGVAANQRLRKRLKALEYDKLLPENSGDSAGKVDLFLPPAKLCTDNAVSIAIRAAFNYQPRSLTEIQADPNLRL